MSAISPCSSVVQALSNAVQAQLQRLSDFVYQAATSLAQAGKQPPASLLSTPAKHLRIVAALLQKSAEYNLTGANLPSALSSIRRAAAALVSAGCATQSKF